MKPTKHEQTNDPQSSKGGVMVSDLTESEKMLFAEMCMYFTDQGIAAPTRLIIEKIIAERDNH